MPHSVDRAGQEEEMVALKKEQLEALRREATGQSTLSHVELDEENETFWAGIAHQLDAAKPQSTTTGLVEALDERKLKALALELPGSVYDDAITPILAALSSYKQEGE
jgi:hypothetical protein